MKVSRTSLKRGVLVFGFAVCALSLTLIIVANSRNSVMSNSQLVVATEVASAVDEQPVVRPGLPRRLKIKKMNVDALVTFVGLTEDGSMDSPKNPNDVAWLKSGKRPGEIGTATITGHYGWMNNTPAVFDNLSKLEEGDKFQIVDSRGATISFVVRKVRSYGPNDDAKEVFRSNDGKSHLNLITCQGDWSKDRESYSSRLVVFAEKE